MTRESVKFAILLMVALGAAPASSAIWQWSTTSATNGNADGTINWQAGMAPSAVEPSGRAMMARLAEWRDDTSGKLVTSGTGTAYTLATNQAVGGAGVCSNGLTAPPNGTQLAFSPHTTNTSTSPTLAVDTCPAAPISLPSTSISLGQAGMLSVGIPYRVTYSSANSAWYLQDVVGNQSPVPLGSILATTVQITSPGYALANGQCLSTTTYQAYWIALGSPSPGSCAANYFAVLDLRGRVPAGIDNMGGSAANRLTSASYGCGISFTSMGVSCANGLEYESLTLSQLPVGITSAGSLSSGSLNYGGNTTLGVPMTPTAANVQSATANTTVPYNFGYLTSTSASWSGVQLGLISATGSVSVSSNNTGGGYHPIVNPNIGVYYYIRVL